MEDLICSCINLCKSYGSRTVLDQVSLEIAPGERVAIMGPSGSGKSTLLNCIGGIDEFDSGSICLAGNQLDWVDESTLSRLRRETVGTVFQFFHLLPTLTVSENISFPLLLMGKSAKQADNAAADWVERMGLSHRADAFPDQLSGGEQQRCAIARALSPSPELLLADEPTGNLDSSTGGRILDVLEQVTREENIALLMVTHSEDATRVCDRTVHMLDGRLEAVTT